MGESYFPPCARVEKLLLKTTSVISTIPIIPLSPFRRLQRSDSRMHNDPTTRRDFLKSGATFVALGATVPAFLQQTVEAATRKGKKRGFRDDERILVVLQMAGGNDGLNTIVPIRDDAYYRLRPKLALKSADTLRLNDDFALHAQAKGLKDLYDAGLLGVVHAVGYPNPNRSHFKSMDIWHTASPDGKMREGWLGRYFDNTCRGAATCEPSDGIALMPQSPLALRGEKFLPLAFEKPSTLGWNAAVRPQPTGKVVTAMNQPRPRDPKQPDTALEYLRRIALDARLSAQQIQEATRQSQSAVTYPRSEIASSLKTVAQLIGAGSKARVYYLAHGGYDTHANQSNRQSRLLADFGAGLSAFLQALKAQGDLDRVLVLCFSEFGRRVAENASGGTDHGTGGVLFVAGGRVQAGFHGTPPDLTNLEQGDVRHSTDFRSVYATVLDEWLGVSSKKILRADFPRLELIKSR